MSDPHIDTKLDDAVPQEQIVTNLFKVDTVLSDKEAHAHFSFSKFVGAVLKRSREVYYGNMILVPLDEDVSLPLN